MVSPSGVFEIVRVVGRGLVSIAKVHAIVAGAHHAQSEPEMARDRFGLLERHGFVKSSSGSVSKAVDELHAMLDARPGRIAALEPPVTGEVSLAVEVAGQLVTLDLRERDHACIAALEPPVTGEVSLAVEVAGQLVTLDLRERDHACLASRNSMASISGSLRQRLALRSASARLPAHSARLKAVMPLGQNWVGGCGAKWITTQWLERRLALARLCGLLFLSTASN